MIWAVKVLGLSQDGSVKFRGSFIIEAWSEMGAKANAERKTKEESPGSYRVTILECYEIRPQSSFDGQAQRGIG